MRTRFLTGDVNWMEYGAKWISPKLNNGDFDYWLVIEFINMEHAGARERDEQPKYVVEVSAVSPQEAGPENLAAAMECCGFTNDMEIKDIIKVEALSDYGVSSPCDSFSGNNGHKLLRQAKRALDPIAGMLGFFLDGPKNGIGHCGWDLIKGDMNINTAIDNRKRWGDNVPQNMHVSA